MYSAGFAPVTPFSMVTNPEDANLSLSEITTPKLRWKGERRRTSATCTVSAPPHSDEDYEVLTESGSHQILRRVDPATLAPQYSFSEALPQPLQPVSETVETPTCSATTTTSTATTTAVSASTATTSSEHSMDTDIV